MTQADAYLRKAERAVEEARVLHQAQKVEGACNRAYYAMFDAARAALLVTGQPVDSIAKTHSGLIAAFGRAVVQTGHLDAAWGRVFNRAQDIRLKADYLADPPELSDAAWAVDQAAAFVATVRDKLFVELDSEG